MASQTVVPRLISYVYSICIHGSDRSGSCAYRRIELLYTFLVFRTMLTTTIQRAE
eukprot:COSAG02_NODE_3459_length_6700_cov_18.795031_8_plen_55_part_00